MELFIINFGDIKMSQRWDKKKTKRCQWEHVRQLKYVQWGSVNEWLWSAERRHLAFTWRFHIPLRINYEMLTESTCPSTLRVHIQMVTKSVIWLSDPASFQVNDLVYIPTNQIAKRKVTMNLKKSIFAISVMCEV